MNPGDGIRQPWGSTMPSRKSVIGGAASASRRTGNRWCWLSWWRPGRRMVAVLAVTGCVAACLAVAGGAVASGSVAAVPGSVVPRPAPAGRFGALRPGLAGLDRAGRTAPGRLGNAAQARPGRRGGFVVLGGSPGAPGRQSEDGDRLRADPVPHQFLCFWAAGPCRRCHQRREMQHEGHFGLPRGGQGQGRQQPARGRDRLQDRHHLCGERDKQHRIGAEWRPVQRPGDPRLRSARGHDQGREVPGRRGVQPGDAQSVCGEPWRRQRLGHQRGQV